MPEKAQNFITQPSNEGEITKKLYERLSTLENSYLAILNILEDFDEERRKFQRVQTATLNLLEDVNEERNKLNDTRSALTNILEDMEIERFKAEKARMQLESTNKELESFSYSVSHDLRAPLRAISGFSEAVMEDYSALLDDNGKRYLKLIAENANNMGQLIDDLLSFSRMGRQEMIKTEVDMNALAKMISNDLISQLDGRDIKFTIHPVPPVHGDKAMIQQVLVNLFSNSVKFTPGKKIFL